MSVVVSTEVWQAVLAFGVAAGITPGLDSASSNTTTNGPWRSGASKISGRLVLSTDMVKPGEA